MSGVLKDFPPGPLDFYREKPSFDWKKLKIFLEGEEGVKTEASLSETLSSRPEFNENSYYVTWDDKRRLVNRQYSTFYSEGLFGYTSNKSLNSRAIYKMVCWLSPAAITKYNMSRYTPIYVLKSNGTQRHQVFIEGFQKGEIHGCFCLTEIGHGSNIRAMRTTAIYDKSTKEFILNCPDFEAAKCWAGNLGQRATHAIVYAQLYIDNKHYGLHIFIVAIRDPKTLKPYVGIKIADMGEKLGLNGLDNGILMFDNYRIPRENFLNGTGDVTEDGEYVANENDNKARSLGTLSYSRVEVVTYSVLFAIKAIVIAIRYSAVRKQSAPDSRNEIPILEYKTYQMKLLPYLAFTYVIRNFSLNLQITYDNLSTDVRNNTASLDLTLELHAISSGLKCFGSWMVRDAIQECKEACGGNGYLTVSELGNLGNDSDPNVTYEGDNNVLLQETCNWLLKLWVNVLSDKPILTPLGSANFLRNAIHILRTDRFSARNLEEICSPGHIYKTYQWLICYLLQISNNKYQNLIQNGVDKLKAKMEINGLFAKKLSSAYVQHFSLQIFEDIIQKSPDQDVRNVLSKIFSLYGIWNLEKFLSTLYQGGFAQGQQMSILTTDAIVHLCDQLKNDAVALVDVLAPDDFILNSVLGSSDGQVYSRLKSALFGAPNALSRPSWWKEMLNKKDTLYSRL